MRALKAALFLLIIAITPALAGPRADHWSGFDLTTGMPFPSVAGLMLGFNTGDEARISAGAGTFVHWATYAIDGKAFLGEGEWAPYIGAGLSYMTGTHAKFLSWDLQFDRAFVPYFEGGMDFQSGIGVHVMFNLAASAPHGTILVLPGLAIGWYF